MNLCVCVCGLSDRKRLHAGGVGAEVGGVKEGDAKGMCCDASPD